jgi:hypothetical protein
MKQTRRKKVTKSKKRKTKQRRQRGGFNLKNIAEAIKDPMIKVFMDLAKWHKENKK